QAARRTQRQAVVLDRMLDPSTPKQSRNLLRDLDDLLAARGLREVELGPLFVSDREDQPKSEGVLAVVPDRFPVPLQVPQVLVEEDLRKEGVGFLDERSIHLDDPLVDLGVDSHEVAIRPLRVEEDVAASCLDRWSHTRES